MAILSLVSSFFLSSSSSFFLFFFLFFSSLYGHYFFFRLGILHILTTKLQIQLHIVNCSGHQKRGINVCKKFSSFFVMLSWNL